MRRVLSFVVLCLVEPVVTAEERPQAVIRVGHLGKPSEFTFEGVTAFRESELRQALSIDVKVLVAGHPLRRLEPFLRVLEERVIQGYRAGGFSEATATAEVADSRNGIVVRVSEGPRILSGDIVLTGLSELSQEGLLACLIEPTANDAPDHSLQKVMAKAQSGYFQSVDIQRQWTTWKPGKPANLAESSREQWQNAVQQACRLQGFFSPKFEIEYEINAATRLANLQVRFDREGPCATLREVEFVGLEKNSRDEMLTFLGLRPGKPAKGIVESAIDQRLEKSGRFVSHKVSFQRVDGEPDAIRLRIEVRELFSAPKVSEPLSPELQTMLKMADWIEHWQERKQDIAFRISAKKAPLEGKMPPSKALLGIFLPDQFEAVIAFSPSRGMIVSAKLVNSLGLPVQVFTAVFSSERLAVWSPLHKLRFDVRGDDPHSEWMRRACLQLMISMTGANQPEETGQSKLNLGFGISSRTTARPSAIKIEMKLAAVTAIGWCRLDKQQAEWIDGVLVLTDDKLRCRIDEATGRLLELRMTPKENAVVIGLLETADGIFDRTLQEYDRGSQTVANTYDPQAPWASFCRFAVPGLVQLWSSKNKLGDAIQQVSGTATNTDPNNNASNVTAYKNLATLGTVAMAALVGDDWNANFDPSDDQPRFGIPSPESPQPHPLAFAGPLVLMLSQQCFTESTWPWSLSRTLALQVMGEQSEAQSSMDGLLKPYTSGPLACFVSAHAVTFVAPNWRSNLVNAGLARLEPSVFRRDVEGFFAEGTRMRPVSVAIAKQLRVVSDDEVRQLAELLLGAATVEPLWPELRRTLREQDTPEEELLPELLEPLWKPVIRPWLERELKVLKDAGKIRTSGLFRLQHLKSGCTLPS